MQTKLYVGGLPYSVDEPELQNLFAPFGTVTSAKVISDRTTGRSRGFGFVEMGSAEEAQKAIAALNGKPFQGRTLPVNEARPQERSGPDAGSRPRGGGYGGGYRDRDRG